MPILSIGVGISLVFMSITDSVMIGRLDARNTLLNAPQAKIEFVSDRPEYLRSNYDNCHGDPFACEFQVIIIGDSFVYLSPVDSKQSQEEELLYAVPIGEIARSLSEKQYSKRYASLVECKDVNNSTTKSRLL